MGASSVRGMGGGELALAAQSSVISNGVNTFRPNFLKSRTAPPSNREASRWLPQSTGKPHSDRLELHTQ